MRTSRRWASTSAAVALAAAALWAGPAAAATLSGTVTAGGRPLDSAVVSVYLDQAGARKAVTITNSAGQWRIVNLAPGPQIVIVEKDGRRIYQGTTTISTDKATFDLKL